MAAFCWLSIAVVVLILSWILRLVNCWSEADSDVTYIFCGVADLGAITVAALTLVGFYDLIK